MLHCVHDLLAEMLQQLKCLPVKTVGTTCLLKPPLLATKLPDQITDESVSERVDIFLKRALVNL